MAAHPTVVIDHGRVDIPQELRSDPRFRDGARLQLVPVSFEVPTQPRTETLEAWQEFLSLGGMLAHSEFDPNLELEKEKQRELEQEAEWARS